MSASVAHKSQRPARSTHALTLSAVCAVALVALAALTPTHAQYCKVNPGVYQNRSLYASPSEMAEFFLKEWFTGFNLSYSVIGTETLGSQVQIHDTVEAKSELTFPSETIVGVSRWLSTNGEMNLTRLEERAQSGEDVYTLHFGYAAGAFAPYYSTSVTLEIDDLLKCFDIAQVSGEVVVIDCLYGDETKGGPFQDVFYIYTADDASLRTKQTFSDYEPNDAVNDRKTLAYYRSGKTYVASAFFFYAVEGVDVYNDTYIELYRYDSTPQGDFQVGQLSHCVRIDAEALGIAQLTLADFAVLDDYLYVLDHYQGVFVLQIDDDGSTLSGARVRTVKRYTLQQLYIGSGWGITVYYEGGQTVLAVAAQERLHTFKFWTFDQQPEQVSVHTFEAELYRRPSEIEMTARYSAVKIGKVIQIFDRDDFDSEDSKFIFENTQDFQLLYADYIYVYYKDKIVPYVLQDATLTIEADELFDREYNVIVRATSVDRLSLSIAPATCDLLVNLVTVPKNTRSLYKTNVDPPQLYEFTEVSYVPLDRYAVGPNLFYFVGLADGASQSAQASYGAQDLQFVVPRVVTAQIDRDNAKNWVFNRVVAISDELFVLINQDINNNLTIYDCVTNYDDVHEVQCAQLSVGANVTLGGRIIAFAAGQWRDLFQMAFVTDDATNTVQFYDFQGNLRASFSPANADSIIDVQVQNNQLYVVDGKARNVTIWEVNPSTQKEELLDYLDEQYTKEWKEFYVGTWSPLKVYADESLPNVIFIQHVEGILAVSVLDCARFLQNLVTNPEGVRMQTGGGITRKAVLAVRADDFAREYSLQDIKEIEALSDYETYGYEFFNKTLTFAISPVSGFLYVLAVTPNTTELAVLVYRSHQPTVNALYAIVDLGVLYNETGQLPVQLSADGQEEVDYVYVNVGGRSVFLNVPFEPAAEIDSVDVFPYYKYTQPIDFRFKIKSFDQSTTFPVDEDVIFVNDQTEIYLNASAASASRIAPQRGGIQMYDLQQEAEWEIDITGWYTGPVLYYDIECEDCGQGKGVISVFNPVQVLDESSFIHRNIFKLRDISGSFLDAQDTLKLFVLAGGSVYGFDDDLGSAGDPIALKVPGFTQAVCYYLFPGYTSNMLEYILAICNGNNEIVVAAIETENYTAINALSLPEIKKFAGAQYREGKLLVLNETLYDSQVVVYDLGKDLAAGGKSRATLVTVFDSSIATIGGQPSDTLRFTAFQILPTDTDNYLKLFLLNETRTVYTLGVQADTFQIVKSKRTGKQDFDTVDVVDKLHKAKQYIERDTPLLALRSIYEDVEPEEGQEYDLLYRILILSDETPIYEFVWNFDSQEDDETAIKYLSGCEPIRVFGDYGTSHLQQYFNVFEEYFAVGYWIPEDSEYVVTVYFANNTFESPPPNNELELPFINMLGGVPILHSVTLPLSPWTPFVLLPQKTTKYPQLFIPDPWPNNAPYIADVTPNKLTIVAASADFAKQRFELYPQSDYGSQVDPVQGLISPPPEHTLVTVGETQSIIFTQKDSVQLFDVVVSSEAKEVVFSAVTSFKSGCSVDFSIGAGGTPIPVHNFVAEQQQEVVSLQDSFKQYCREQGVLSPRCTIAFNVTSNCNGPFAVQLLVYQYLKSQQTQSSAIELMLDSELSQTLFRSVKSNSPFEYRYFTDVIKPGFYTLNVNYDLNTVSGVLKVNKLDNKGDEVQDNDYLPIEPEDNDLINEQQQDPLKIANMQSYTISSQNPFKLAISFYGVANTQASVRAPITFQFTNSFDLNSTVNGTFVPEDQRGTVQAKWNQYYDSYYFKATSALNALQIVLNGCYDKVTETPLCIATVCLKGRTCYVSSFLEHRLIQLQAGDEYAITVSPANSTPSAADTPRKYKLEFRAGKDFIPGVVLGAEMDATFNKFYYAVVKDFYQGNNLLNVTLNNIEIVLFDDVKRSVKAYNDEGAVSANFYFRGCTKNDYMNGLCFIPNEVDYQFVLKNVQIGETRSYQITELNTNDYYLFSVIPNTPGDTESETFNINYVVRNDTTYVPPDPDRQPLNTYVQKQSTLNKNNPVEYYKIPVDRLSTSEIVISGAVSDTAYPITVQFKSDLHIVDEFNSTELTAVQSFTQSDFLNLCIEKDVLSPNCTVPLQVSSKWSNDVKYTLLVTVYKKDAVNGDAEKIDTNNDYSQSIFSTVDTSMIFEYRFYTNNVKNFYTIALNFNSNETQAVLKVKQQPQLSRPLRDSDFYQLSTIEIQQLQDQPPSGPQTIGLQSVSYNPNTAQTVAVSVFVIKRANTVQSPVTVHVKTAYEKVADVSGSNLPEPVQGAVAKQAGHYFDAYRFHVTSDTAAILFQLQSCYDSATQTYNCVALVCTLNEACVNAVATTQNVLNVKSGSDYFVVVSGTQLELQGYELALKGEQDAIPQKQSGTDVLEVFRGQYYAVLSGVDAKSNSFKIQLQAFETRLSTPNSQGQYKSGNITDPSADFYFNSCSKQSFAEGQCTIPTPQNNKFKTLDIKAGTSVDVKIPKASINDVYIYTIYPNTGTDASQEMFIIQYNVADKYEDQGGDDTSSDGLGGGAIAGIVIGAVVGVAIIAFAVYYFVKKRKVDKSDTASVSNYSEMKA